MKYRYSLSYIDIENTTTKKQLIDLLNKHDKNSFIYSIRTAQLNMAISKELNLPKEKVYLHFQCGLLHDVGKLGMSFEFINYPAAYTLDMYQEMKKHTIGGVTLLKAINAETELVETANYHHCNFDGTGYPASLYYDEIPLHARITRISDSIDAYMSKRCYKEGGPTYEVWNDLNQYKGTSYDPFLLDAFAIIHKKIMTASHDLGIDRPSQKFYMSLLDKFYGTDELTHFTTEHLDSSYLKNLS
ncbi:hypothetical protein CN918_32590 [Priestia megaterium]|nr:hypothetical protein CN918_32590 [Priestia megaterium]